MERFGTPLPRLYRHVVPFLVMTLHVPFGFALLAGFVSFLAPCVLPLVPGYLSAVSAVEADRLADLHPLRGRVGRSHHRAYCYLLVDEGYAKSFKELMETTEWEKYGVGRNPKTGVEVAIHEVHGRAGHLHAVRPRLALSLEAVQAYSAYLFGIDGEIDSLCWSPDGRRLLCTVRKTDTEVLEREKDEQKKKLGVVFRRYDRLFYKLDGYGYLPQERVHIWVIDARTGKGRQLTDHPVWDELDPAFSPDGRQIALVRRVPSPGPAGSISSTAVVASPPPCSPSTTAPRKLASRGSST